jgi:hypothetical protein
MENGLAYLAPLTATKKKKGFYGSGSRYDDNGTIELGGKSCRKLL